MAASKGRGRRLIGPAVILLVGLTVLSACAALPVAAPGGTPTGPFELTVVHSNDTWGYLDPCG